MTAQKLKIFVCLIMLCMIQASYADKIRVVLQQPPPNQMGVKDLWKMNITNTTRENIKIYLTGSGTESKKGSIVSGKSKILTILPGTKTYTYEDFKSGEVNWNDKGIQEILFRTGSVPEGEYTICVTAFYENGETAFNETCIDHLVKQMGSITLTMPEDGAKLNGEEPLMFSWTPLPEAKEYKLRIVEIKGDQSPEAAMNNNREVFSATSKSPSYQPRGGEHLPWPLVKKKKYAWQVSSGNVESEVSSFILAWDTDTDAGQKLTLISPKVGGEVDMEKEVTFEWTPVTPKSGELVTYRLRVWQLMQGQNGTQAMKENQPIFTKETDNISQITVTNLNAAGPCPPFICQFVWSVQVKNSEGFGENNVTSEPSSFKIISKETLPKIQEYVFGSKDNRGRCVAGTGLCLLAGKYYGQEINLNQIRSKLAYDNGVLTIELTSPFDDNRKEVMLLDDKFIEDKNRMEAGLEFIAMKKGAYKVDYSSNVYGTVKINAINKRPQILIVEYDKEKFVKIDFGKTEILSFANDNDYILSICESNGNTIVCSGPAFGNECRGTVDILNKAENIEDIINNSEKANKINEALTKAGLKPEVNTGDKSDTNHVHPERIIYDSGKNVLGEARKDKSGELKIFIDEARLLELSKKERDSLKISKEDFIKSLRDYLTNGEVNPGWLQWPIECWYDPCDGSCGWSLSCPGILRCKWVGFVK